MAIKILDHTINAHIVIVARMNCSKGGREDVSWWNICVRYSNDENCLEKILPVFLLRQNALKVLGGAKQTLSLLLS